MAQPTPTSRVSPNGIHLDDGHQSLWIMANEPDLDIFEKSVQSPAFEGGDPIDNTTMHNAVWMTFRAQQLKSMEEMVVVALFDPAVYDTAQGEINVEQSMTDAFPEGSYICFWGYLRRIEAGARVKGTPTEMTLTIHPTNWDPYNCVEAGPIFFDGTGSC